MHEQTPAAVPPERQFDFWLGEWDVTWGDDHTGVNRVQAILDERVILENFESSAAQSLRGMSVSVYNRALDRWQQTWVDNQGSYLDFIGGFKDGKMVLQRNALAQGKPVVQRMVWYNIAGDSLDWNWERSEDNGRTWIVIWRIHYARAGRQ